MHLLDARASFFFVCDCNAEHEFSLIELIKCVFLLKEKFVEELNVDNMGIYICWNYIFLLSDTSTL